ncbi:MAG: ABC transporter permease [Microbacterium sp.]
MSAARIRALVRLELTQRVRSVAWYVLLGVFAFLLLVVTALSFLAFGGSEHRGASVYSIVAFFVLLLVVLVSPTLSGNAVNGDRDQATLAAVQVTLATTADIVLAKFLAAWITGLAFLVVAVPFIAVSMIGGGASGVALLVSVAVLIVETAVVAAIGVGLSGILGRPLFSVASTYLVVAAFVVGTLIAFGLGGLAMQTPSIDRYRSYIYDDNGEVGSDPECGAWEEYPRDVPRFDYVWWMLAANPFVVLADATPTTFGGNEYPSDLFGWISFSVRSAQLAPELNTVWDDCDPATQNQQDRSAEEIMGTTAPSWFVGLAVQLVVAGGLLVWGGARTRTPARRLPPGTRIA